MSFRTATLREVTVLGRRPRARAHRLLSLEQPQWAERDLLSWLAAALGAAVGLGLFLLTYRGLVDDAYITLAFAKNVALHGQWAVTPGLLSNTATSPGFVLLLAAVTLITRGPVVSLGLVTIASLAVTAAAVTAVARGAGWAWWAGSLVAVLLATSPLMASTVGLESFLLIAVIAGLLWAVQGGRLVVTGLLCGLVVLVRPDAVVFPVLALVALLAAPRTHSLLRMVLVPTGVAALVMVPWTIESLRLFGTPIPDTLVWKTSGKGLGTSLFGNATPLFFEHWPAATALSVTIVLFGVVALFGWLRTAPRHPVTILIGGGAAVHYSVMSALGVGPFTWYYAPTTAGAVMLIAFGLAFVFRPGQVRHRRGVRQSRTQVPSALVLAAPVFLLLAGCLSYMNNHDYVAQSSPFHANGATALQYQAIAASIPADSVLETAHGEVGTLAYFCRCTVVDPLSDRGRLDPLIAVELAAPGVKGAVLRMFYAGWHPQGPVTADVETTYARVGFSTWSGFTGWGHIAVVPDPVEHLPEGDVGS